MSEFLELTRRTLCDEKQKSYRFFLQKQFSRSEDFCAFRSFIGNELQKFGIRAWAYSIVDLPGHQMASEQLGNLHPELIEIYTERQLYMNDIALQHIKRSRTPILQSSVERELQNSTLLVEYYRAYKEIVNVNKGFGYEDTLNLPIMSAIDGSLISLSVTSKGMSSRKFREVTSNKISDLHTIGLAINDIGVTLHKREFLGPLVQYKSIANGRPLQLLKLMGKNDWNVKDVAKYKNLSLNTVNNHLKAIRSSLSAGTNHGAYEEARKRGFID